ncbi:MAG: hypothetical protein IH978_04040 [Nitrospinae bacterium]|nr:hypothetical protein [Nitrospinota bacterium]
MGSISYRKLIGLSALVLLVIVGFVFSKPASKRLNIPNDPKAEEALELVQSHPARNAPTLQDAVERYLRELEAKGTPFHKGEWQVGEEQPGVYAVRILIREKGFNQWIEREFAWRVMMKDQTIRVISLAAIHFMPFHELPPLPHQDQIS